MQYVKQLECVACGAHYDVSAGFMTCPKCGELGILDVIYDYERLRLLMTKAFFRDNTHHSMWRYLPLLPVRSADTSLPLAVGNTPLYAARKLAKEVGLADLYVKDEGLNPTLSLKDRASAIAVCKAVEARKTVVSCSSTGNAASSLAGNAAHAGLKSVIFVPKRAPLGKLTQLSIFGALIVKVDGDYRDAFELSKQAIAHYGFYDRNAAINPYLVEGKKTVALEVAEQLDFAPIDWVVVSVGDGCTIAGVYKGFYDLLQLGLIERIPRLLGVQAEGCRPLANAAITGKLLQEQENTLADSIAVGIPRNPLKALQAVKKSHGEWIAVADQEILEAMRLLGRTEGIFAEPAAAAALAGLRLAVHRDIIGEGDKIVLISTGNGIKDPHNAQKAVSEPVIMKNDLQTFINYYETSQKETR